MDWLINALAPIANRWNWLGSIINRIAINRAVNVSRTRPHPWSNVHPYVSWTSMSDRTWSARHLPETETPRSVPETAEMEDLLAVLLRGSHAPKFCDKSTLLFPAFAQYLTDGFIRTRMPNKSQGEKDDLRRQNTSNHQIDMCTLYGRTSAQTDALRLKAGGDQRGRLKSQLIETEDGQTEEWAPFLYDEHGTLRPEFALLDEPLGIDHCPPHCRQRIFAFGGDRTNAVPQVAMINTLFLREHNRLAGKLATQYTEWDDDRVFETARNIIIVLMIKIVVEEYINHISPYAFRFRADPSVAWIAPWNQPNWITTEFSLLYRWHSLVPDVIKWDGIPHPVMTTLFNNQLLIRKGLAAAFVDMSAQAAGKLGPFNVPQELKEIEAGGIIQNRVCRLQPYAAYREYCSLPRPKTFADISPDPAVQAALSHAYKDKPEDVDFYVGIFCEEAERNSPLPPLIRALVAVDAFSQALTNPLLSKHAFKESTFSSIGWSLINSEQTLRDLVERNTPGPLGERRISMTQASWKRK